jgi:hypothetical protein
MPHTEGGGVFASPPYTLSRARGALSMNVWKALEYLSDQFPNAASLIYEQEQHHFRRRHCRAQGTDLDAIVSSSCVFGRRRLTNRCQNPTELNPKSEHEEYDC